jgi:RNA polymerase sigma factor (sigma-70 family)
MGEMHDQSDAQLLRDYAEHGAEASFAEIVARHTDLVYSAALRQVYSPDLARDVTQSVFTDLARKARIVSASLSPEASLVGWLYRGTRFAARDLYRNETRRTQRERQAMEQLHPAPETPPDWEQLRPVLDDAMSELDDTDREAVLLRYFKNHDLRTVGATLGISDDAAQKRVSRAVERLRGFFAKRGVTVGAGGLAVVISTNAVQAAPVGLALTISTAAALTGTTLATTATLTATKAIAMTTLQKTIVTATIAVLAGAGIYEARQVSQLREQVQTLQQEQAEQIQQLKSEHDDAMSKLTALREDNQRLNRNTGELLKLRGEVSRLRNDSKELAEMRTAKAQEEKAPTASSAKTMIDRLVQLQQRLEQNPSEAIPEIQFTKPSHWLNSMDFKLETEDDYRRASYLLRNQAQNRFSVLIKEALSKYSQANNGQFPSDLSQLNPYCDAAVGNALIQLYEIAPASVVRDSHVDGDWIIARKIRANPDSTLRLATFMGGSVWYNSDSRD